jgi:hypothetical protein
LFLLQQRVGVVRRHARGSPAHRLGLC